MPPLIDDRPARILAAEAASRAEEPRDAARRTLAMRIAHRNRLRELRAERLARLRPACAAAPAAGTLAPGDDAAGALEDFLRALTGSLASETVAPPLPADLPPDLPAAGEVLPFGRPEAAQPAAAAARPAICDLALLPGVGDGLVWALRRAGLHRLADLAPLEPAELAARLGPLGRLVPAAAWIACARALPDPRPGA